MANFDKYKVGKDTSEEQKTPQKEKTKIYVEDTPMYRAYGVTRKVYPFFEKIKGIILTITVTCIVAVPVIFLVFGFAMIAAFNDLGRLFVLSVLGVAILFFPARLMIKRALFVKRLKAFAKSRGYKLKFKRNFFASLLYSPDKYDFTLDTRKKLWCVKFLCSPTYNRRYVFESAERIVIFKGLTKNRIKEAYGITKPKRVEKEFSFKYPKDLRTKEAALAVVFNPVPKEMFVKQKDGVLEPSGTGAWVFGYTVFSGSGFISSLDREDVSY